ncbi:RNA polymerase sigma factor SigJ [Nonomuraea muscovyensis]|uniref:RNA polymerase sigma-70 factor (ECF subfamily) n=1 Tax=Nonomuraea muscovyensis TaxID=1124761 RepID=A0A7X0F039_9ACTN|nr:RNA polymerase sigma factor SigJ [Nonomuraea muscovyensis]MBB6348154.1 RNA polymerase sigma-70 factor (ECF subfamily) [Nonomuraea muscovyensis]MDF2707182.1 polymerase subunit sigma-70 [Nonomuraea muscovyensis]
MNDSDYLADRFEAHRSHLKAVAYRMLGSLAEADDAVQEAWLRLSRTDTSDVTNLGGWLTTVVGRVCLDMLRSRTSRREGSFEEHLPDPVVSPADGADPEQQALIADSVGLALLVVLESLAPAERLAFVLHDMFGVPFEEIAPIVGRTPAAARKMASRARTRVRGAAPAPDPDLARQRQAVDAFLAAARDGDFHALVAILDPDVVLRADRGAVGAGLVRVNGVAAVAGMLDTFHRFATAYAVHPALVNGMAGFVSAADGQPMSVLSFTVADGRIAAIDILSDPGRLAGLDLSLLDA